jgi:hypothetical protein
MENENSFKYKLSKPFTYAKAGEEETCYELEFFAPSYKCFGYASKLEQALTRALMQARKVHQESNPNIEVKDKTIEELKESKEDLKQLVSLSFMVSNENLEFCISDFINMCSYICEIESGKALQKKYFDKIDYNDLKDMFFEYVSNFLMPSFFAKD